MKNTFWLIRNATHHYMQSHIVIDESGAVLIIDGGTRGDAEYLLNKLREITGKEIPQVSWFFTHPHSDHMDCFFEIIEQYPAALEIEHIYCCFPSVQYFEGLSAAETAATFWKLSPAFADKIVPLSEDDVYPIGTGCRFEVLRTADCSIKENQGNNSSTVIKLYLGETTILILGDLGAEGADALLKAKPQKLKSDYCQVAHHGQRGSTRALYEAVAPRGCIWTAPDWLWNPEKNEFDFTHNLIEIEWRWMQELGVQEHYVVHSGDVKIES